MNRRHLLRSAAAVTGAAAAGPALPGVAAGAEPVTVPATGTHLVLLGTSGGPVPFAGRSGMASAVVVDGYAYLVDLGHGAFDQIGRAGISPERIPAAFLTHLHSDHVADAFSLPWLRFGGVNALGMPLHVHGPGRAGALPPPRAGQPVRTVNPDLPTPGTVDFFAGVINAAAYDINLRLRDEGWPDIGEMLVPHDIAVPGDVAGPGAVAPPMEPFPVMADDRVRVSAILVDHPPVFPAFGFRFDTDHGAIVFSGDTTVSDNLVRLARGADVLVHEVIDLAALRLQPDLTEAQIAHLTESHTDVRAVGAIAQRAGVGTLVLSHLSPGAKALPDEGWQRQAQRGFDGRVVVGNDLDVLRLRPRGRRES
ncbi:MULTISPECIES: MBL fold metallo-hydrolase [Catenuloplanes]|uniref:Ribonuclease BN (tRNA processing enzyme) n=1 Tax=Catenuloplanes niger TaxID=587534 RepID=A0AAE3ZUI0_9ACTN|nr:MBL fold metallo-hydrolase [Catenuloplanes niger]MDR7325921.1 ribonuclease BN (tRNA processing enzyme) [Catenuloplanes niger]